MRRRKDNQGPLAVLNKRERATLRAAEAVLTGVVEIEDDVLDPAYTRLHAALVEFNEVLSAKDGRTR